MNNDLTVYDTLTAEDMRQVSEKHRENPYGKFPSLERVVVRFLEEVRVLTSKSGAGGVVLGLSTLGHQYPGFVSETFQYDYQAVIEVLEDLEYTLTEIPKSSERCTILGKEVPILEGFDPKTTFYEKYLLKYYTMIWDSNKPIFQEAATSNHNVLILTTGS